MRKNKKRIQKMTTLLEQYKTLYSPTELKILSDELWKEIRNNNQILDKRAEFMFKLKDKLDNKLPLSEEEQKTLQIILNDE